MLIALLTLATLPFLQAQDEKKPAPQDPAAQEKPAPKDPAQDKKDPPDEKKPQDDKKPQENPPQEPPAEPPPSGVDILAGLRLGGWWIKEFEAFIPAGRRRIERTLLFDAGIDLEAELHGWTLGVTGDFGTAKHLTVETGGLLIGHKWALDDDPLPFELHVAAGPLFGKLDTDVTGFGDFKSAVGFAARVDVTSWLHKHVGLGLWLDYRQMSFKFDENVLMGDEKAGGPMFAAGVALLMRF